MQYKVRIVEEYTREIVVDAPDEGAAYDMVDEQIGDGLIDLPCDGGDYDYKRDLFVSANKENNEDAPKTTKTPPNMVRGFKVFRPDWTCRPDGNFKQYTCPRKFEEDVTLIRCGSGMHFCENLADCFNYYQFNPDNKVAEVIAYGDVVTEDDKSCTNKLEIVRELTWNEVLYLVNTGKNCAGRGNTGDWNKSSFNTGCFNTIEQKLIMFNKPSDWTREMWLHSDAIYLLNQIPKDVVKWIYSEDMTDEEKAARPTRKTIGGYLKILNESKIRQSWWNGLSSKQKKIITDIPNFDPDIFKEITGIDVRKKIIKNQKAGRFNSICFFYL